MDQLYIFVAINFVNSQPAIPCPNVVLCNAQNFLREFENELHIQKLKFIFTIDPTKSTMRAIHQSSLLLPLTPYIPSLMQSLSKYC